MLVIRIFRFENEDSITKINCFIKFDRKIYYQQDPVPGLNIAKKN